MILEFAKSNLPALFALALAPALFWFWFFARRDRHPEPARLLLQTFLWGAAVLLPAGLFENAIENTSGAILVLVLSGVVEESAKFLATTSILGHKEFDEPVDGLVYATAASLGYASLENFIYLMTGGPDLIAVRGGVSTLGHILFAMPWGFALGQHRFVRHFPGAQTWARRKGLAMGALFHSLFNLFLHESGVKGGEWLLIPFAALMLLMWRMAGRYYARANKNEK